MPKEPKVAVDSCFAIIVARQSGVTNGEALLKITRSHPQNHAISRVSRRVRVKVSR